MKTLKNIAVGGLILAVAVVVNVSLVAVGMWYLLPVTVFGQCVMASELAEGCE